MGQEGKNRQEEETRDGNAGQCGQAEGEKSE